MERSEQQKQRGKRKGKEGQGGEREEEVLDEVRTSATRTGRRRDGNDGEETPRSAGVRNPQHAVEPGAHRSNDPTSPSSLFSPVTPLLLLHLRRTPRPLADELSIATMILRHFRPLKGVVTKTLPCTHLQ